jgi:hypothetical protein
MSSEVQICNVALSKLGESPIIALTEDSKAGRACNLIYTDTRDNLLRAHPWNFAVRRASLARLTTIPAYGFAYEYQLPTGCLKVLSMDPEGDDIKFKVEGRKVLTDEAPANLLYIIRVTDSTQFDTLFTEVLSAKLSAELAVTLTDSINLADFLHQKYENALSEARGMDAQEGTPDNIIADTWIASRL